MLREVSHLGLAFVPSEPSLKKQGAPNPGGLEGQRQGLAGALQLRGRPDPREKALLGEEAERGPAGCGRKKKGDSQGLGQGRIWDRKGDSQQGTLEGICLGL